MISLSVPGAVDFAHPARAELLNYQVVGDVLRYNTSPAVSLTAGLNRLDAAERCRIPAARIYKPTLQRVHYTRMSEERKSSESDYRASAVSQTCDVANDCSPLCWVGLPKVQGRGSRSLLAPALARLQLTVCLRSRGPTVEP